MAHAAIVYDNLADAGTVTASSWIAAAPPSMLQNQHVTRRWKGRNGDSEFVLTGLIANFDTIALFGLQGVFGDDQRNLSAAAVTLVRISSVDSTGVAGDLYDSDDDDGHQGIDEAYAGLITILEAAVSGYVRIDFSETGAAALLAGRLVVGLRNAYEENFEFGWSFGYVDLSRLRKSAGGQTFIDRDDRYRVLNLNFPVVVESDRYGFVHEADRLNGLSSDVLFITDPASDALDRDSIWGLVKDLSPVTNPYPELFAKSYSIEERR